jgi:hypothetical protein
MSQSPDPFENFEVHRLKLFLYLVPIIGCLPALWTLYQQQGTRRERELSRVAVTLAFSWLLSYGLLGIGAQSSEALSLPFLLTSSLLTSGYFVTNLWLMVRLWQRKPVRLPQQRSKSRDRSNQDKAM